MFYMLNDKRVKNVYDIDDIDDIPYLALYYVFIDEDIIDNSMEQKEEEIETEKELEIPKHIREYLELPKKPVNARKTCQRFTKM